MSSLNIQSKIEEIRSKFASRPKLLGQMTSGPGIGASGIKVFGQGLGLGTGLGTGTGPVMTALQNLRSTIQKSRPGLIGGTPFMGGMKASKSGMLSGMLPSLPNLLQRQAASNPASPPSQPKAPLGSTSAKIKTY